MGHMPGFGCCKTSATEGACWALAQMVDCKPFGGCGVAEGIIETLLESTTLSGGCGAICTELTAEIGAISCVALEGMCAPLIAGVEAGCNLGCQSAWNAYGGGADGFSQALAEAIVKYALQC